MRSEQRSRGNREIFFAAFATEAERPIRAAGFISIKRTAERADRSTVGINDDASAPHLNEEEFAVIDTTDRELQNGELYIVQYQSGDRARHIRQVSSNFTQITETGPKQLVWWVCELRGYRQVGLAPEGCIPMFTGVSDGPYRGHDLEAKMIGRVVGSAHTALGNLLETVAGWENEAEGNAAFNPAEYLDVMIATGHRPYLMRGRDGHLIYGEAMPERAQTDEAHESALASVEMVPSFESARASKGRMRAQGHGGVMTAIGYLNRPPAGWFALDVMRRKARSQDWVALMVDYDPDDYDSGEPNYIGPPANAHDAWVLIPGKHCSRDAACDAFDDMIATRH